MLRHAGVAELADALASGASELRLVEVQVLSPAPIRTKAPYRGFFLMQTCPDQKSLDYQNQYHLLMAHNRYSVFWLIPQKAQL